MILDYLIADINNIDSKNLTDLKLNKYYHKSASQQTLAALYLLDKLLNKYNLSLKDLKYVDNKPTIPNYYISITHKDNYVACVISSYQVGIDLEKIVDFNPIVLNYFFSQQEKEYILTNSNPQKAFFQIFTFKECLVKINGQGLKGFFDLNVINDNSINLNNYQVKFHQFDNYLLTIVFKK